MQLTPASGTSSAALRTVIVPSRIVPPAHCTAVLPLQTYWVDVTSSSSRKRSPSRSSPVWIAAPPPGQLTPSGSESTRTSVFGPPRETSLLHAAAATRTQGQRRGLMETPWRPEAGGRRASVAASRAAIAEI